MSIVIRDTRQTVSSRPLTAPRAPGRALYQARFSLGDSPNLVGMQTGAGDGLRLDVWQGDANMLAVSGGQVIKGSGPTIGFNGLPISGVGGAMFVDIPTLPTSGSIYLDLFRGTLGGSPNGYRLEINTSGMRLRERVSGTINTLSGYATLTAGDRIGFRYAGGVLTGYRNGVAVLMAAATSLTLNGFVGFAQAAAVGFAFDNFDAEVY